MSKVHVFEDENVSDLDSGSEADVESELENSEGSDRNGSEDEENKKSGMADAMARILGKKVPNKKGVIMAKAMTDKQIERKRKIKEQGGNEESEVKKVYIDQQTRQAKRKEWENRGRLKPDPLDKPAERILQRIATRGVVQLFNAVSKQQKILDDQLQEAGSSERRKDKVVELLTKDKFLDILKGGTDGSTKSTKQKKSTKNKPKKNSEEKDGDENPKWSILRDDFMMGATMKDWDKEGSDGEGLPDD